MVRMILIQEHKIIEDECSNVNSSLTIVFIDDTIELLHELYFPDTEFCDDLEEKAKSSDSFLLAFAKLWVKSKANSVLLLVLQLSPKIIDYNF